MRFVHFLPAMKCKYSFLSLLLSPFAYSQTTDPKPEDLEEVVVSASPLQRTLSELAQPATVLQGDQLRDKMQSTLGETLNGQPGVSSTNFGPGASRPIIRGLGDDRVRILQNGTSVLDVSNVSPDHAVAADVSQLRSIEVVRGPATLLYGPNAVGGVVNMIDDRIPDTRFEGTWPSGSFETRYGSVDDLFSNSGSVKWGKGPWAFYFDAFQRETNDISIPGFARSRRLRDLDPQPDEAYGTLPNSFSDTSGASLGGSHIWDRGYIGLAYSGMDSNYGTVAEEDVTIDMHQRRWELRGAFYEPSEWIKEINYKFSYSDYDHAEIEGGAVGTEFLIDGYNLRSELQHQPWHGFTGVFGFERQQNDFSALGDEAFLPTVENQVNSIFAFEEYKIRQFTLQFGARYDYQQNETATLDLDFNALSLSAGIVYEPNEDYAISYSMAYSQRPPTYIELLADGLHVATGTYEEGDASLGTESALSFDLSLRKKTGRITGSVSAFYYRFRDFISLQPTGSDFIDGGDLFPIFAYETSAAEFYGAEMEMKWHLLEPITAQQQSADRLDIVMKADYVSATDPDTNEALPRIAPFRCSLGLDYQKDHLSAQIEGQWVTDQDRTADYELPTAGYFMLNAGLSYDITLAQTRSTIFIKGVNLLDEEARQSTSFLKDVAPLAGRGMIVGIRTEF